MPGTGFFSREDPLDDDWPHLREVEELSENEGPAEAALRLRALLRTSPHPLGWFNLGVLLRRTEDLAGALEAFEKAAEMAPDRPEAANAVGLVWDDLGRLSRAEEAYRRALDIDPGYAPAWNNWGVSAFLRKDYREARRRFREALRLDPDDTEARLNLEDLTDLPGEPT